MPDAKPFISVIIPVYQGEGFLPEALESVQRQAYQPLETILIDDGSTDGTRAVAASFAAVRYLYQPNRGPAAARNLGLRLAQGDVIGFLDADDLWPPNSLDFLIGCLAEDPAMEVVQGHTQMQRLADTANGRRRFEPFLQPRRLCQLGTTLFRKSAFDKVGLFDETMRSGEDVDWFLRATELGIPIMVRDRVVHHYRLHQHNMSRNHTMRDHYFIKALTKSIARRRLAGAGPAPSPPPDTSPARPAGGAPAATEA